MKLRTVLRSAAAAAVVLGGSLAVTSSPAQAAWTCQAGYVCFYENANLTGSVAVLPELSMSSPSWPGQAADFRNYSYYNGHNLNDSVSSVINRTNRTLWVYEHGNFNQSKRGRYNGIGAGQAFNFGHDEELQDNRASSARFYE
ncbi:peptidase inhibitor family I36 protein [Paractinoplanes atraurantiacus]|uniref:Peptidase inhibitor family I36 n=1 Tax=Paractinoplanes atraurantiacus TaxID=1036182 RepID=A0A285GN45_9ACTN|nr:peptidase inhibitor family I36 protein [Actinoplanes atraurantiacus]SNY24977.1 Peptidase inhibitor family I36 [Actinoplanes atraurantiacus]